MTSLPGPPSTGGMSVADALESALMQPAGFRQGILAPASRASSGMAGIPPLWLALGLFQLQVKSRLPSQAKLLSATWASALMAVGSPNTARATGLPLPPLDWRPEPSIMAACHPKNIFKTPSGCTATFTFSPSIPSGTSLRFVSRLASSTT